MSGVEMPLKAVVSVVTKDAEDSIEGLADIFTKAFDDINHQLEISNELLDDISDNTANLDDTMEASSQKQTNSWGRVGKAIAGVTLLAGGFLSKMISSSPALAGSLDEIGFQFERIFNVLGDSLVPMIEVLIPYIEDMTDLFMDLDGDVQTMIASFVALAFGAGALTTVLGFLGISIASVAWPILIIIAAVAALALAWHTNFFGIQEKTAAVFGVIGDLFSSFASDNSSTFQELIDNVVRLWEVIEPIVMAIGEILWDLFVIKLESMIQLVIAIVDGFIDIIGGIVKILIGLFTWDIALIGEGLGDIFKGLINMLVGLLNFLIVDSVNALIELINNIPGVNIGWRLGDIPSMHSGGVVGGGSGTEEVLRVLKIGEGVIDADTMKKGIGGSGGMTINVNMYNTQVRNNRDIETVRSNVEMGVNTGIKKISLFTNGGYVG